MDLTFAFLSQTDHELLDGIVSRRKTELWARVQRSQSVSRSDIEQLLLTLNDEFLDHLDEEWEPTDYGKAVDRILRQINKVQIQTWP